MDTGTPQGPAAGQEPPQDFANLGERLAPKLEEMQAQLEATNEKVKKFIRENPGSCVLGAAVLGFVIGKWASRR